MGGGPRSSAETVDERIEWLASLLPDPSQPVPEASAAEVTANGPPIVDALEALLEAERVEEASWAIARLRPYWLNGGNVEQGRRWAERVQALPGQASPAPRVRLLETAATLAFESGDEASARNLFTKSAELACRVGDADAEASALGGLARCELMAGNLDAARGRRGRAKPFALGKVTRRRESARCTSSPTPTTSQGTTMRREQVSIARWRWAGGSASGTGKRRR